MVCLGVSIVVCAPLLRDVGDRGARVEYCLRELLFLVLGLVQALVRTF